MSSNNTASITASQLESIRDSAFNLVQDMRELDLNRSKLVHDLKAHGLIGPERNPNSVEEFSAITVTLTATVAELRKTEDLQQIRKDLNLGTTSPAQSAPSRRPTTRAGRFFSKVAELVG